LDNLPPAVVGIECKGDCVCLCVATPRWRVHDTRVARARHPDVLSCCS
jgi:hypothetical protein